MRFSTLIPPSVVVALLFAELAAPTPAAAWSGCGSSYIVEWGDTLGSVAGKCGTSVAALRLANPGLGYWLYAGQTLWLPVAYMDIWTAGMAMTHTTSPAAIRSGSWRPASGPPWTPWQA